MNQYATKFDDSLNAILVKELRQTVRGKFLWTTFNLFLLIMVIALTLALSEGRRASGNDTITFLFIILYFACFFLVPLYVGKKVNTEKKDGMNELLSITTMSPKSIVMGKFLCGLIIITMLYCAFTPFMSLTVFMGGIDMHELIITTILSYTFCMLAVLFQIGLGLEALGIASLGVLVKIIGIVIQITMFSSSLSVCMECLRGKGVDNYAYLCAWLIGELIVGGIMFATSVSFLQPDTANKSYSLRKYLSILWVIGICLVFGIPAELEGINVGLIFLLVFVSGSYIREPEYYSARIIKDIPSNLFQRFIKFPLYTGLANGFAWVAITTIVSSLVVGFVNSYCNPGFSSRDRYGTVLFVIIATLNAFVLMGNYIRKTFFSNYSRGASALIGIILYLVVGCLPFLILGIMRIHFDGARAIAIWINPIVGLFENEQVMAVVSSFLLLMLGLTLNGSTLMRQTKHYFELTAYDEEN